MDNSKFQELVRFLNKRRDARMTTDWDVLLQKVGEPEDNLSPEVAAVYERVRPDTSDVGKQFVGRLRNVSVNGAFIQGVPLPVFSRVAIAFELPHFRDVEALGWVMWRRRDECRIKSKQGEAVKLEAGCGVVFEWMSLEARLEIARRITLLG